MRSHKNTTEEGNGSEQGGEELAESAEAEGEEGECKSLYSCLYSPRSFGRGQPVQKNNKFSI